MSNVRRASNLPFLKEDIYLVVEGEVDELFINRIISFIPSKYNVRIRVANGNGNIPIHVNILKKIYSYSKIFVLYDLDANYTLEDVKRFLKAKEVVLEDESIFFVNPCIEYLISLTKEFNKEKCHNKKDYQWLIRKYFFINDYGGHIPQVEDMVEQIQYEDFKLLIENLELVSTNDEELPSTNFGNFLKMIKK